jgi:hypothetical protein
MEIPHIDKPLVPEAGPLEVEIAIAKFKGMHRKVSIKFW